MQKWYKVISFPPPPNPEEWWNRHMSTREGLFIILREDNPREKGAIGLLVKPKGLLSDGQIQ
jgi:hypothetical protein